MTQSDAAASDAALGPDRVREITHQILLDTGVPESNLNSSVTLEDLGLDSSDVVQIELDLQRNTGLKVELRDLFPALTVDTLVTKAMQAAEQP